MSVLAKVLAGIAVATLGVLIVLRTQMSAVPAAGPGTIVSAPASTGSANPYDPSVGVVPYFASSPFSGKIPSPPTVNPNSATWVAGLGNFSLNDIGAFDRTRILNDHGEPIYLNRSGSATPVRIHCTANYGGIPCNVEGQTVYIDPREIPQNGDAPGQDDHLVLMDPGAGYEYDFWVVQQWPPKNGVLAVNWGGRCALNGNGFTNPSYAGPSWNGGCGSVAAGAPVSMGLVRAKDLLAAASTGGTLPQAIAVAVTCPGRGSLPAPFLGSGDGKCDGHAPEGSRLYLAMHDSDVNALAAAPIVKAILRTLDEDHYGAFIIDTGGTQSGIQIQAESDSTYTAWGLPGPWLTQFIPEAVREGLPGADAPANGEYQVQLPIPASVVAAVRFL